MSASTGVITSSHHYEIPLSRADVWERISDMDAYRGWWSWLRDFDAAGLEQGAKWACTVQPPLPYVVRFTVELVEVDAPSLIRAEVRGDVVGSATLKLEDDDAAGTVAHLSSSLAPGNQVLRIVSRLASPVARFGHDWVIDSGARQFIAHAVMPSVAD